MTETIPSSPTPAKPEPVTGSSLFDWAFVSLMLSAAVFILTCAWNIAVDWTSTNRTVSAHGVRLDDHEQRLRANEQLLHEMVVDVRWIRSTLEARGAQQP